MAKKKEKTLEEKLQEALVPENQWPYILPENWCWLQISKLYDVGSSKRIHKSDWIDKGIPFIRTRELVKLSETGYVDNDLFISELLYEELKAKYGVPKYGDILISGVGTIGVPYIVKGKKQFYFKDGNVIWLKPKVKINASYIFWLYKSQFVINQIKAMSSGTTVDTYTITNANNTLLPIPPLLEQKRIVHRIESLFAKLDEAKEKIQQVLDGAEMRKAAILHKAFTGELTKTWRRENNITTTDDVNREKLSKECEEYDIPYEIPDEWRWVTFNEVCTFIGSGVTPKGGQAVYTDSGIPFIRSQNVLNGKLDLSDVAYISDEINEKMKRTQIIGGETLLNITGASIGRSCYVPQEQSVGNVNQHVCILRFKNYINGYIPQLWLNSPKMQEFINFNQVGQTRQALNFKQIRGIYFPLPPLQEQLEMVRIIKYEINKLDVVCNSLANLAVRIDTMKKSILAKAFRGELGTNNPNEDSAINLLKEVLQDKF